MLNDDPIISKKSSKVAKRQRKENPETEGYNT